mgnify:CR=1 FL=1
MKIKALIAAASLGSIFLISSPISNAQEGHQQMIVDSFAEMGNGGSELFAIPEEQVQKIIHNVETNYRPTLKKCDAINSDPCSSQSGLSMRIYLPACSATISNFCIDALSVSSSADGPLQSASLLGYTGTKTFAADPNRGVPAASTTSRWKVAGVNHKGGSDTYAVKLLMDAFSSASSKDIYVFEVSAIVEPYIETQNVVDTNICNSWQLDNLCGQRSDFNVGQKVSLSVRLPNTITGWLHGRLKNSSISVDKYDANQNKVTVSAETVQVPELNTVLTDAQFNSLPNPSYFTPNGESWNSVNSGNTAALEWVKVSTSAYRSMAIKIAAKRLLLPCFVDV